MIVIDSSVIVRKKQMNEYLQDLIGRINDKSDRKIVAGYDSSKTISWKALREAEKIKNPEYIDLLVSYIENEKDKKKRGSAYFILGKIAKNINDLKIGQFLINRIEKETDKYIIGSLLDRLADIIKPKDTNLEPLISATKDSKWQIRHSAIQALSLTENETAEERLIEILKNSNENYDLIYANSTLGKIGSEKSIPYLQKMLDNKSQDVSSSALSVLIKIAKEKEINTYRKYLVKGKLKVSAISGVVEYGDETDIVMITKRIKELVSRKRSIEIILEKGKTEIIVALEFLKKFKPYKKEYSKLLDWLLLKKKDKLWETEINWIEKE